MRVVDAHVHLWDPSRLRYSWLDGTELDRLIDASTLRAASGTVTDFVVVHADCADTQGLAEVEWLVEQSDQLPGLRGIVAFAPLERGADVRDYLAALRANPSVVGVRRLIQETRLRRRRSLPGRCRHAGRFRAHVRRLRAQLTAG
jgi:L-fuconolactonase